MDINYKLIDTQRIIDYIISFPKGVSVEEISKFRVLKSYGYIPLFLNWNRVDSWKYWRGKSLEHH